MRPGDAPENLPLDILRDIGAQAVHHQNLGLLSRVNHGFLHVGQMSDHVQGLVCPDDYDSDIGRPLSRVRSGVLRPEPGREQNDERR